VRPARHILPSWLSGPDAKSARFRAKALIGFAVVLAMVGIMVPAGHGWDFANFYDTGHRAAAGQINDIYNPATPIDGVSPEGKMAFWSPPISAWFYAPLSLFPPAVALVLFKLVATVAFAVALLLLYREVVRLNPEDGVPEFGLAFMVLVLLFQPFWTIYRVGGQTTPVAFLLLVIGLRAYLRENVWVTALCLLLSILIKPAFLFIPAFLALVSGRRFLSPLALVFLSAGLLSLLLLGWTIHREFLEVLRRGSEKPSPWPFNSSLYILAEMFRPIANSIPIPGRGLFVAGILRNAIKFAVLLVFAGIMLRNRRFPWPPERRRLFDYLMAISFCLLISQVVWEHYLALLFIPLVFLFAGLSRLTHPARIHLGVIIGLCALQNLVFVQFFRDRVPVTSTPMLILVSLVKAGPLLGLLTFLWLHRQQVYRLLHPQGPTETSEMPVPVNV
jgi:hypothetical protein